MHIGSPAETLTGDASTPAPPSRADAEHYTGFPTVDEIAAAAARIAVLDFDERGAVLCWLSITRPDLIAQALAAIEELKEYGNPS